MDIAQLQAFLAVAEELHFGRAAERLHVAQPPLSRTIKQLERELGTRLFDRNTRSVRLTASGRVLVDGAREVLDAIRRAEVVVKAADSGEVGLVRVAFAGVSTHHLVAQLARVVRQHRPGIRLELYSQYFAQPALRKLVNGDVDMALGRWDAVGDGISARVVLHDSLVVAVPDTHQLADRRQLSISELSGEGFVSLPPFEGSVLSDRLSRLAHEAGFSANIVQIAPDTQTALALVDAEVGCHLTLASVAENVTQRHVEFIPLNDQTLDVDLRLAWRTEDDNPALRSVLTLVDEALPLSIAAR
jgi:DNA-binding transcriptional LysR family regulator